MSDQIGRVLSGRYRLIAPIGSGSSAQVFLADDARLRRRVAVKVLHAALADDEAFLRRFRAEAQAAAALNHPNIVAVYDWGEDDGEPYLITEFLGGGSLRGVLDGGHRLTPSQALLVGLETTRGLDYAHRRGFVHRDIKPANLLFGEDGRLRIADFGLARALAEAAWTEPQGAVLGTARYASPEQARGEAVDGRSDVYGLGLVLIESVTGRVPFASDTTIATLMARVDRAVEVPPELGPLARVLARAGRPDPADRPDAGEFAVGLMAAAEELARPEPLPLAGAVAVGDLHPEDRDPTLLPTRAESAVDLRDGTAFVPAPPLDEVVLEPAEPATRRRWPRFLLALLVVALLGAGAAWAYVNVALPSHEIPELVSLDREAAVALIEQNGWRAEVRETRQDGTTAGQVLAQNPAPGESLRERRAVVLTVSLGQELRTVPTDLGGLPFEEASARLGAANLAAGEPQHAFSEDVPAGSVIGLAPDTPAELETGTAVVLVVSDGPTPRQVPAIAQGASFDDACAALAEVQLGCERVDVFSDTVDEGGVVATAPAAGVDAPRDSAVEVQVSKGVELIAIPDVRGRSVEDAIQILEQAGFEIAGVEGNPNREVLGTDPPAGEEHQRGTAVRIFTRR